MVIDELVGVWLVLLPFARPGFGLVLAAFAFFRLFDILKPWPVRASETWLPAGFGVMIDDVLAGPVGPGLRGPAALAGPGVSLLAGRLWDRRDVAACGPRERGPRYFIRYVMRPRVRS